MINALESSSTRPYLIRALYEWCTDNGFTPYVAVQVDDSVQVPREYVRNGEIVLNISYDATSSLKLGNEFIEFKARFAGTAREIIVPVGRVIAIYARENGQGMAFPIAPPAAVSTSSMAPSVTTRVLRVSEADSKGVVKLVPAEESAPISLMPETVKPGDESGGDDSHRPSGGGLRPALKRIK